jgi:hypothetical protein
MILTVFGCVFGGVLAIWIAGAVVMYWKQLLLVIGVLCCLAAGLFVWDGHQVHIANERYTKEHPSKLLDPEQRRLADDIYLAIHYWRDK